jgi:dipeptidase
MWNGPENDPKTKGKMYVNERSIGVQISSWHFVSNMRGNLPRQVGTVFWFGVDDARFSVHIPFYPFVEVPKAIATGTGSIMDFDPNSLFWMKNMVANRVYWQWDVRIMS